MTLTYAELLGEIEKDNLEEIAIEAEFIGIASKGMEKCKYGSDLYWAYLKAIEASEIYIKEKYQEIENGRKQNQAVRGI